MINLAMNSESLEVGSELTGSCIWIPDTQEKNKPLILTIGWRTEGRGNVDKEVLYETEVKPSQRAYFRCKIPMAGPISYDGELLRIIWEIIVIRKQWIRGNKLKTQVLQVIPRQT
ncbi:MAG: hypothetical protein AAFW70_26175 [Cyanobacteria bacterium J06635_10]